MDPRKLEELRRISAEQRAREEAGTPSLSAYSLAEARSSRIPLDIRGPCPHEGAVIEWCNSCRGERKHVRECDLHEKCTREYVSNRVQSCERCDDHPIRVREREKAERAKAEAEKRSREMTKIRWAYGVTTVPSRRDDLLPRTLESLKRAGFDSPILFVDGHPDPVSWRDEFGLEVVTRSPVIRTFGNWVLSLAELYIRNHDHERFAMFQDDFVTCVGLREYLTRTPYPEKGYLNLYTMPSNEQIKPRELEAGWYLSNQFGRGAVALVFDNETVVKLLTSLHMVTRPKDVTKGWKNIDGGIVTALKKAGVSEYVHSPSLVQHTGLTSSMGNKKQKLALSFRGEGFDCRTLLKEGEGMTVRAAM